MAEERKEIQLVDPLYEPMIMYPMKTKDLPYCKDCRYGQITTPIIFADFQRYYREVVRKEVRDKLLCDGWKNTEDMQKIDFNRSIERQLRTKTFSPPFKKSIREYLEGCRRRNKCFNDNKLFNVSRNFKNLIFKNPHKEPPSLTFEYGYSLPNIALKELYDLYNELINTFEMQRLMYLQMTGFLSFRYHSSTHTRFAHAVGTWISGLIALQNVTVVTDRGEMRLIEFLANEDMHREFMAALILHDIGHAPFSHVLEMNPYLEYDHEKITEELIRGGEAYLILEDLLVSSYLDMEYGYDEKYGVVSGILKVAKDIRGSKEKFVLVHDVIESMGLDEDIIVELFSDNRKEDPAVNALKGLIHGVIDIDRIDHIYRDLHYNSFKTMGIPLISLYRGTKIHYGEEEPWIKISEEITPIIETLIAAREQSHKAIFDNPVNNFYIAVLNSAVSDAIRMFPLIKYYIPFLTDGALLHVLINRDLFHNLSPTEKAGIITGSSFGHLDYKFFTYTIRKNDGGPPKLDKKLVFEIISEKTEEIGGGEVFWYAFLKDVKGAYESKNSTKVYIGEKNDGNALDEKLEKYIDGVTWDGQIYRSWTFTLFTKLGKQENDVEKIKEGIEKELNMEVKVEDVGRGVVR